MRLAVIYSDPRGRYLVKGFSSICDVVDVDLTSSKLLIYQKILSYISSFHFNKNLWKNEFDRCPLSVNFRSKNGNKIIKKLNNNVDAILQFGSMNRFDYSLLKSKNIFYYFDGPYDKSSKIWSCSRFENYFINMQKNLFDNAIRLFTFSSWAKYKLINNFKIDCNKIVDVGWGPCLPVEFTNINVRKNIKKILYIGRSGKWKGVDILLKAIDLVRCEYKDINLDVIGVGENEVSWKKCDWVNFHGKQSQDYVVKIIEGSDLFVLPSLYERAGHATIEAMWYGCPVIVSNSCGAPEPVLSGQCGLLVEPGSVESLRNAILILLNKPDFISIYSKNAIVEARSNWSWDVVCNRMIDEIKKYI